MTTWLAAGPPALGITVGADADIDRGWLVRPLRAGAGLDGPAGILQGGLASGIPAIAARLADTFGAPLTGVDARLHAPTPLERELQLALRPGDGVARHEVQLRDDDRLLVSATVELAGHEPAPQVADLTELATVPVPPQAPQEVYPVCWVCGQRSPHQHGQRLTFGYHGAAIVTPWLAEDALADVDLVVDPLVVSAVLDCPGVWAAMPSLEADGWVGCLLGGMQIRHVKDAPAYEPLRLVAIHDSTDGRKVRVRSALVDEAGVVYALAAALHVAVREVPAPAT
jgi:hypothetical protein